MAFLAIIFLISNLIPGIGNTQTCMSFDQPVVESIEPLSGITGTNAALSTRYTINGERLDKVSEITVKRETTSGPEIIPLVDSLRESSSISFDLDTAVLPPGGTKAIVLVVPTNPDCSTLSLTIYLHDQSE